MTIRDLLAETKAAILSNKTRSGLTMLGIVIGIASVIVMLAIGGGAQATIQNNIQSIGSNLLTVTPGGSSSRPGEINVGRGNVQTLTLADADAIKKELSPAAQYVSPEVQSRGQVVYSGKNTNTSIVGVLPDYMPARNIAIDVGTFISESQARGMARVAVLGPTTRDDLFGAGADPVGQKIRISDQTFTVIGVTASKGGSSFGNADDRIFIPLSSAQQYLTGSNFVSTIAVSADSADSMTSLQSDITTLLLSRHHISNSSSADFTIVNQADIANTLSSVTQTFTILMGGIGAISLLVGGIGIMNMMLTIVRERTREIGLRKAIGAKRRDINVQFLFESIALTVIGGIIGIILGVGVAQLLTLTGLVQTQVQLYAVLLSFGVSVLVGIVFGYYPARNASLLNPIDALRYE